MSTPLHKRRAHRVGIILAAGAALAALPATAHASAVDLGTAAPFVVLGGSSVTNTGPSVLNGDLGVSPGTSLVGFGLPAVVNGATHNNDAVAAQAKSDLVTAYDVAASQPVTSDLTGQDLGGLSLTAGAYRHASSAQLTGQLTLDAQGDPAAQFVFEIGSTLTTASASSVRLVNGASPCNVYWQVGSSATLGSTTAFQGNVLALTSITLNNGASVVGRMLARNGAITLDDNTLDATQCATPATTPPSTSPTPAPTATAPSATATPEPDGGTAAGGDDGPGPDTTPGGGNSGGSGDGLDVSGGGLTRDGTARLTSGGSLSRCTRGFRAAVRGRRIERVVFSVGGRRIAVRTRRDFHVRVRPALGRRGTLEAMVTFTDDTRAKRLRFRYRACAAKVLRPADGPSQFTG